MTRDNAINLFGGDHVTVRGQQGVWCVCGRERRWVQERRAEILFFFLVREGDGAELRDVEHQPLTRIKTHWDGRGLINTATDAVIVAL